MLVFLFL